MLVFPKYTQHRAGAVGDGYTQPQGTHGLEEEAGVLTVSCCVRCGRGSFCAPATKSLVSTEEGERASAGTPGKFPGGGVL